MFYLLNILRIMSLVVNRYHSLPNRHSCPCKSFIFLLVNLIAVSLHCSNYIGKTSHHFR